MPATDQTSEPEGSDALPDPEATATPEAIAQVTDQVQGTPEPPGVESPEPAATLAPTVVAVAPSEGEAEEARGATTKARNLAVVGIILVLGVGAVGAVGVALVAGLWLRRRRM